MARVLVTMAGKQSEAASRRIRNKRRHITYAGIPTGRCRPFGWHEDKRTRDESERQLLMEAAADVLNGVGLNTICREWNAQGIKTSKGKPWTKTALKHVLMAPGLLGLPFIRVR
jgi:site-specific DNA recombinase